MENEVLLAQYKIVHEEISRHGKEKAIFDVAFLASCIALVIASGVFVKWYFMGPSVFKGHIHMLKMLLICGMLLTLAWLGTNLRVQMKLKLRYFQARYFERALGTKEHGIYTDEKDFFGKSRKLESPDATEMVKYPRNLDGFFARINPSVWGWFLPMIFLVTFITLFKILTAYK